MARYAIGDIQGCYRQLTQLLNKIDFNPSKDILYLVGDLVNRGPQSLDVIKWIYKNQDSVISVLGNHDIYLLARYFNIVKPDSDDTLGQLLKDKNINKYMDWLRTLSIVYHDSDYIITHAGVYPQMNFNDLLSCNHAISNHLQSSRCRSFLLDIYGNKPNSWNIEYDLFKKMKFTINACTRMRFLNTKDLSLDYKYKGEINNAPKDLTPWFNVEFDKSITKPIIFGHWAALGLKQTEQFSAIDTGCAWGRKLTALNLENQEITQVDYSA